MFFVCLFYTFFTRFSSELWNNYVWFHNFALVCLRFKRTCVPPLCWGSFKYVQTSSLHRKSNTFDCKVASVRLGRGITSFPQTNLPASFCKNPFMRKHYTLQSVLHGSSFILNLTEMPLVLFFIFIMPDTPDMNDTLLQRFPLSQYASLSLPRASTYTHTLVKTPFELRFLCVNYLTYLKSEHIKKHEHWKRGFLLIVCVCVCAWETEAL